MKKVYQYIVIVVVAVLFSSMAGIIGSILNSTIKDTIVSSYPDKSHPDTETSIDILTLHTPYILTSQEKIPTFLPQANPKTQTTYRTDAIHLQTHLYTAYKKNLEEQNSHISQLRSDGHYLYALCQMRI